MKNFNTIAYKNKHCAACTQKNINKYGSFDIDCDGILVEQSVAEAKKLVS